MMKRKSVFPLIISALVILFNPIINIIDILPDCIAYALLIYVIGELDKKLPYIAECKGVPMKLEGIEMLGSDPFSNKNFIASKLLASTA